jgi:hypothetical protein
MNGVSLAMSDVLRSSSSVHMRDMSQLLGPTWRRTVRRRGGFFVGTAELTEQQVDRRWMEDFFKYGLRREIREVGSGQVTWQGMLVKMEFTKGQDVFIYDYTSTANAIKVLYTAIGDNVLTNGSGESGTWTDYAGATVTQDDTWSSHGDYSIKVVSAGGIDGSYLGGTNGYVLPIVAGAQYLIRATLKVTSGSWRLSCNRESDDESLAKYSTKGAQGDHVVEIEIPETNEFEGDADLRITCEASGAGSTVNVDAVVFQLGPHSADTGWYSDRKSITVFGRKEDVLLESGMSVANAQARAQSEILRRAWPNPTPPATGEARGENASEYKLRLTFAGDWYRLFWLHTTLHGTRTMSEWVRALVGLQTTVGLGRIMENSTEYYVEDQAPLKLGEVLKMIAGDGEIGGARWGIGVYADRKLAYERIDETLKYKYQNGKFGHILGGKVAPWLARPGWLLYQDMPLGGSSLTTHAAHDPRWVFAEEVEMMPPDREHGNEPWVRWSKDEGSDIQ